MLARTVCAGGVLGGRMTRRDGAGATGYPGLMAFKLSAPSASSARGDRSEPRGGTPRLGTGTAAAAGSPRAGCRGCGASGDSRARQWLFVLLLLLRSAVSEAWPGVGAAVLGPGEAEPPPLALSLPAGGCHGAELWQASTSPFCHPQSHFLLSWHPMGFRHGPAWGARSWLLWAEWQCPPPGCGVPMPVPSPRAPAPCHGGEQPVARPRCERSHHPPGLCKRAQLSHALGHLRHTLRWPSLFFHATMPLCSSILLCPGCCSPPQSRGLLPGGGSAGDTSQDPGGFWGRGGSC